MDDIEEMDWIWAENKINSTLCLCWLDECACQFQRHRGPFTFCESIEIWEKCSGKEIHKGNNEEINYGDKTLIPHKLNTRPRIIEYIWCLCCNHMFFADHSEAYVCPKCHKEISFEKENMRYIVDK